MRLLLDNSVSWRVGRDLRQAGHDTVHVADLGMAESADDPIYGRAVAENRVVLTQDSDFGPIHAAANARVGVVLLKLSDGRPRVQAELLIANIPALETDLQNRAFVTITDDLIQVQL